MKGNHWIRTHSGKQYRYLNPRAEDIDIKDIGHSLSNLCRYAGHTREFYSVAQHSVLTVSYLMRRGVGISALRCALLHDATEAYVVDIPSPLKKLLTDYREAEAEVAAIVRRRFGLMDPFPASIKEADIAVGLAEVRDLMRRLQGWPEFPVAPMIDKVEPMGPGRAKQLFLDMASHLAILGA